MQEPKLLVSLGLVVLLVVSFLLGTNFNKEETYTEDKPKQIKQEKTLSMMIEQTAGEGDYKMETRSSWPTGGYMFNATLSKCENGGELGWDETKGVITMTGNMSDKCYIYFDKLNTFSIDNVTFYATPNMTWAEWVNSNYNTEKYESFVYSLFNSRTPLIISSIDCNCGGGYLAVKSDITGYVKPSDNIIGNIDYITIQYGGVV